MFFADCFLVICFTELYNAFLENNASLSESVWKRGSKTKRIKKPALDCIKQESQALTDCSSRAISIIQTVSFSREDRAVQSQVILLVFVMEEEATSR